MAPSPRTTRTSPARPARTPRRGSADGPAPAPPVGPLPPGTPVLVLGATGQVGRHVVRALLDRGATVRAMLRDPDGADVPAGVERVPGDLRDAASVRAALHGARAAFYVTPHEADEEALAATVLAACEEAGVRLVFVGVHVHARTWLRRTLLRTVVARALPHYRAKLALARSVARSPLRPVLLVPTNFLQNDEVLAGELLAGRYPTPLGRTGVNRVDLRDLGEVAARALLDGDVAPGAHPVVGPRSVDGPTSAAAWASALGRPVTYVGDDDAAMEAALRRHLHGQRLADWTATFRVLRGLSMATSPGDVRTTTALLGRPPRDLDDYVRDTVASWADAVPGAQKPSAARLAASHTR